MQVPANQNVFDGGQHNVVVYASPQEAFGLHRSAMLLECVLQARHATVPDV